MECGRADLARVFGVTVRTVSEWCKDPEFPTLERRSPRRGGHRYETRDVIEWYCVRALQGDSYDLNLERARLAREQADREALRNARERLELVETDVVIGHLTSIISECRSRLLGLPVKAAPRVIGLTDLNTVHAELAELVRDSLASLSVEVLFEAAGLSPALAAATEAHDVRVGGPVSQAQSGELSGAGAVGLPEDAV